MAERIVFDEAALADLFDSPAGPVGKELARRATRMTTRIKRDLSKPGTGRTYGRRRHRASAPGQAPAVDTGRLRASIANELGRDGRGLFARIGTNVDYAPHLELGTSKMAARPFLRPALAAEAAES